MRHSFWGERPIRLMKQRALLPNLSRGQLDDDDALYTALNEDHLPGAGLEFFTYEPYSGK